MSIYDDDNPIGLDTLSWDAVNAAYDESVDTVPLEVEPIDLNFEEDEEEDFLQPESVPLDQLSWDDVNARLSPEEDVTPKTIKQSRFESQHVDPDTRGEALQIRDADEQWRGIPFPVTQYERELDKYRKQSEDEAVASLDYSKAPTTLKNIADPTEGVLFRGDEQDSVEVESSMFDSAAAWMKGIWREHIIDPFLGGMASEKVMLLESEDVFGDLTEAQAADLAQQKKLAETIRSNRQPFEISDLWTFGAPLKFIKGMPSAVAETAGQQAEMIFQSAEEVVTDSVWSKLAEGKTEEITPLDVMTFIPLVDLAVNYSTKIPRSTIGEIKSELKEIRGPEGDDLPEEVEDGLAVVLGSMSAGVEMLDLAVVGKVGTKVFPAKAAEKEIRRKIIDLARTNPKMRQALGKIGLMVAANMGTNAVQEGTQEALNIVANNIGRGWVGEAPIEGAERWTRIWDATIFGAQAGPGQAIVTSPLIYMDHKRRVRQAEQVQEVANFYAGKSEESNLLKRYPAKYYQWLKDTINEHGGSDNFTMPLDKFDEYLEAAGISIEDLQADMPAIVENHKAAQESGTMTIPAELYGSTFGTDETFQQFAGDVRYHQMVPTNNEITEMQQNVTSIKQDLEAAKSDDNYEQTVQEFKDRFSDLGTPDIVEQYAQMVAEHFIAMSKRADITIDEMDQMFRLYAVNQPLQEADLTASITAIQNEQIPTDADIYGITLQDYVAEFDDPYGPEAKEAAVDAGFFDVEDVKDLDPKDYAAKMDSETPTYAYGKEDTKLLERREAIIELQDQAKAMGVDLNQGTVQEVVDKIMSIRMDQAAGWTDQRVERILEEEDQKSMVAWVHPNDFIRATTGGPEGFEAIQQEAGDLDVERIRREGQTPTLWVDEETGEITGHEGRHRMSAMFAGGMRKVPVIVRYGSRGDRAAQSALELQGQDFGTTRGTNITLSGAEPITWENKENLRSMMGEEGRFLFQTATVRAGQETLEKYGLDPGKRYKTRAVAAALEARQREKYGSIERGDHSDQAVDNISDWMVEEVLFEMINPDASGVGWYSEKFQAALDVMAEKFPELKTDQGARDLMTALIAITSDGQKVMPNFAMAMNIYGNFKKDGQFKSDRGHSRAASITGNLKKLQQMYEDMGPEKMRDFLMQEKKVGELNKIAREQGIKFASQYKVDVDMPMAAVIFGPKLGAFYANLMGAHGYLTMDRWWSRTFNRYRGSLLTAPTQAGLQRFRELIGQPDLSDDETIAATVEPHDSYEAKGFKDGTVIEKAANTIYKKAFTELEDAPFNASDRSFMLEAVNKAQEKLKAQGHDISIADIQAILWYYEKRLYGELGTVMTADVSYEEAAKAVVGGRLDTLKQAVGTEDFEGFADGEARGYIQMNDARDYFKITLTGRANLSTFLHESGHFFLETLNSLASREDASEQLLNDLDAVRRWVGWEEGQTEFTREQHEKFARGYEAYLREGKAPNQRLRNAFRRFSSWLKKIYPSVEGLNVDLDDEIRGVMDRMLASDDAIEQMRRLHDIKPMLSSAQQANMTEKQYQDMVDSFTAAIEESEEELRTKIMEEVSTQKRRQWNRAKKQVKKDITERVRTRPVYQALHYLKTGELINKDQETDALGKLDRDTVKSYFKDPKIITKLPRGITVKEQGADPDLVAQHFGFKSGQQMVQAIFDADPIKDVINAETDLAMQELFGSSLEDADIIGEEATAALHNDKMSGVILSELKQASAMLGIDLPKGFLRQVQMFADLEVSRMKVKDLRSGYRFMQLEQQYAKRAFQAAAEGDWVQAVEHKRKQLINHWMYRKVNNTAKPEIDKGYRFLKRSEGKTTQTNLGKAGGAYLEAHNKLLEGVELKKVSNRELNRRSQRSLQKMLESIDNSGQPVVMDEQFKDEGNLQNYAEMTLDEFRGLIDAIKNLQGLARHKNKIESETRQMEFDTAANSISESIYRHKKATKKYMEQNERWFDKVRSKIRSWDASLLKPEFLFQQFDGNTYGIVQEMMFEPIARAEKAYKDRITQLDKTLTQPFNKMSGDQKKRLMTKFDFLGTKMYGYEVMAVLLNMGNESNKKKLIDGYNKEGRNWSENRLRDEINRILEPEDLQLVQHIWDEVNQFWEEIVELSRSTTGVVPPKIEASTIKIGEVELRGGYYPVVYDPNRSQLANVISDKTATDLFERNMVRNNVTSGFREGRTEVAEPLLLDLSLLGNHFNEVVYYLTHYEAIDQVWRLLKDKRIRTAMYETVGKEYHDDLLLWVKNIANKGKQATTPNFAVSFLTRLAHGSSIVAMSGSLSTALIQLLGMSTTLAVIGTRWTASGVAQIASPDQWRLAWEKSNEIKHLMKTWDRDGRAVSERMMMNLNKTGKLTHFTTMATVWGFGLIGAVQQVVSTATWLGAYSKGINAMDMDEDRAAMYADSILRTAQSSGSLKDLSAMQRDAGLVKIFTAFYGWFASLYGLLRGTGRLAISERKFMQAGWRMMALVFLPVMIEKITRDGLPDDEEPPEEWIKEYAIDSGLFMTSTIPVLRDVMNGLVKPYGYQFAPAGRTIERSIYALRKLPGAVNGEKELTMRDGIKLLEMGGAIGHFPTKPVTRPAEYYFAYINGEVEEPIREFIFGVKK